METQKLWAQIIGIVLLLVGILGFFMTSPLLGLFEVNSTHSIVHILTGLIFIWAGFFNGAPTKAVNKWIGVVYVLVAVVGFFGILDSLLMVKGGADPDNFLHLGIGIISALIGWLVE